MPAAIYTGSKKYEELQSRRSTWAVTMVMCGVYVFVTLSATLLAFPKDNVWLALALISTLLSASLACIICYQRLHRADHAFPHHYRWWKAH